MPFTKEKNFYKYLNPESSTVFVFIHGLGLTLHAFYPVGLTLSKDYGCLLIDNPGAGQTELKTESLSIKEIGSHVLQVLEETGALQKRLVLVGHSMSGMVVNYLAAEKPEGIDIQACALISPIHPSAAAKPGFEEFLSRVTDAKNLESTADFMAFHAVGAKCSNMKRSLLHSMVMSSSVSGFSANCVALISSCSHEKEFQAYYDKIDVPVLLLLGKEDPVTPYKDTALAFDAIQARKKVVLVENVSHWAMLEDENTVSAQLKSLAETSA
ncbi:Alpha/beta hydrolase family protein [Clavispora lusitaniae]|uniref:AB hydrolase-1 domain-containing protein n=1 Tax=Clavispora lusitaniae (strain ATCC 42720) TaxID=306902 RepID=C4Y247_CLAL4|nr:uncharacterized protein CLUG_02279 [Clavispora lusitaniae ATCC 42720]EEQ38156.1 hypothetical protein CLUG_02279 [Clavispora lusitaniae ATCC 42720]KAF7582938.1 Alpha/beta hydrolase family protein [Clavispora lusitaniae]